MITIIIHKNDDDIIIPNTAAFDVSDYIKTNTIIGLLFRNNTLHIATTE